MIKSKLIFFPRAYCQAMNADLLIPKLLFPLLCSVTSVVSDPATPWPEAHQAPLTMGILQERYCSGLPFPTPGLPSITLACYQNLKKKLRSEPHHYSPILFFNYFQKWYSKLFYFKWHISLHRYFLGRNSMYFRRRQWHPTPVFLPGESQGRGSLVGCRLWGHIELDTTEVT